MSFLADIRKALRDQLAADTDVKAMFGTNVLEDCTPDPSNCDCIVIRKYRVKEMREEFGKGYETTLVFELVVDAIMIKQHQADGDAAQLKADQVIREAIENDTTLGCKVAYATPTYTQWGIETNRHERYHTQVNVEITAYVNPTNRG